MLERLLDIEITEQGTVIEEMELICTMTGFRSRFLVRAAGGTLRRSLARSRARRFSCRPRR
jgi:hypothetical protein